MVRIYPRTPPKPTDSNHNATGGRVYHRERAIAIIQKLEEPNREGYFAPDIVRSAWKDDDPNIRLHTKALNDYFIKKCVHSHNADAEKEGYTLQELRNGLSRQTYEKAVQTINEVCRLYKKALKEGKTNIEYYFSHSTGIITEKYIASSKPNIFRYSRSFTRPDTSNVTAVTPYHHQLTLFFLNHTELAQVPIETEKKQSLLFLLSCFQLHPRKPIQMVRNRSGEKSGSNSFDSPSVIPISSLEGMRSQISPPTKDHARSHKDLAFIPPLHVIDVESCPGSDILVSVSSDSRTNHRVCEDESNVYPHDERREQNPPKSNTRLKRQWFSNVFQTPLKGKVVALLIMSLLLATGPNTILPPDVQQLEKEESDLLYTENLSLFKMSQTQSIGPYIRRRNKAFYTNKRDPLFKGAASPLVLAKNEMFSSLLKHSEFECPN